MCGVTRVKCNCLELGDPQKTLGVNIISLPEVLESRGYLGGPRFCLGLQRCLDPSTGTSLMCMFLCGE